MGTSLCLSTARSICCMNRVQLRVRVSRCHAGLRRRRLPRSQSLPAGRPFPTTSTHTRSSSLITFDTVRWLTTPCASFHSCGLRVSCCVWARVCVRAADFLGFIRNKLIKGVVEVSYYQSCSGNGFHPEQA